VLSHLGCGEEHAVVVPVVHAVTAVAVQLHHVILQAAAAKAPSVAFDAPALFLHY
jgi:hypothetical protein